MAEIYQLNHRAMVTYFEVRIAGHHLHNFALRRSLVRTHCLCVQISVILLLACRTRFAISAISPLCSINAPASAANCLRHRATCHSQNFDEGVGGCGIADSLKKRNANGCDSAASVIQDGKGNVDNALDLITLSLVESTLSDPAQLPWQIVRRTRAIVFAP
jgi:hypothetical protein